LIDGGRAGITHKETAEEIHSVAAIAWQGPAGVFIARAISGRARSIANCIKNKIREYPA
jgi:3-phosphoglycerate kinase